MDDSILKSKFSNIFINLLYSIMINDITKVRHFLSDEVASEIEKIIEIKLEDYNSQNGNTEEAIRKFVFIKKNNNTPKAYPRKAGTPSKNPL